MARQQGQAPTPILNQTAGTAPPTVPVGANSALPPRHGVMPAQQPKTEAEQIVNALNQHSKLVDGALAERLRALSVNTPTI